jgi:glycosyltransferase involved in cell wall biosynthesis
MRHGGPPKAAQELCRELARRGEDVCIYTTDLDGYGRLPVVVDKPIRGDDGVERWYFSTQRSGLYGFSMAMVKAIRRNLRSFDIVHIHTLYRFSSTLAAHYCRSYGVPYILRPHGTLDPYIYSRHRMRKMIYETLIEKKNLQRAAAVHFTAAEEMRLAQSLGLKFRGIVVPLGVDAPKSQVHRADLRERFANEWPETRDSKIILFLGRLTEKKGLDILVEAFAQLVHQRSDVRLFLAGPDDEGYGDKVKSWLAAKGVMHRATFAGMLTGQRKDAAIASADVFVLPSYTENFGFAVVEALAAGIPSVISNKINIWREVRDAGAAIVVNCDPGEVASALLNVLNDSDISERLAAAGRELVARQFNWSIVVDQILALYRKILAENSNLNSTTAVLA